MWRHTDSIDDNQGKTVTVITGYEEQGQPSDLLTEGLCWSMTLTGCLLSEKSSGAFCEVSVQLGLTY